MTSRILNKLMILCFGVLLLPTISNAKTFRNAYLSFELPDTWSCQLEHTEWVCRSDNEKESKEAIIILTAKEAGPTDSLDSYSGHLNSPKPLQGTGNPSQVTSPAKQTTVNDHTWVDGLHLNSEVQNYFTRYLASIKDRISVLVTLSAHKDVYTKYSADFVKVVQSLRIIATPDLLASGSNQISPGDGSGLFGGGPVSTVEDKPIIMAPTGPGSKKSAESNQTKMIFIGAGILLAAVGVYIFLKTRNG